MADWSTISSLATAAGTLVLAVATFSSVRSANRAARTAERALQVGLRPVLFPSHLQDERQKIRWGDDHLASLAGGRATIEEVESVIYMAISLRNMASGIAVIQGWRVRPAVGPSSPTAPIDAGRAGLIDHPDLEEFRPQGVDLYVPAGEISFWQAAIREAIDPDRAGIHDAVGGRRSVTIDLLYGDHEGGQRTISRFIVTPPHEGSDWLCRVIRHWNLDRQDPRYG
jgi:hypothetical protein